MTCLYPNPSELAYLWRFVTSSISHYCHGFRTMEYFSANNIRSFVVRHTFMHFCQSLLLASLIKSHFVWLSSQFRASSHYWNCWVLLLFLRHSLTDMKKTPSSLMLRYNQSLELYFYLDRHPVGAHWDWSLLQMCKALSSEVSLMPLYFFQHRTENWLKCQSNFSAWNVVDFYYVILSSQKYPQTLGAVYYTHSVLSSVFHTSFV